MGQEVQVHRVDGISRSIWAGRRTEDGPFTTLAIKESVSYTSYPSKRHWHTMLAQILPVYDLLS